MLHHLQGRWGVYVVAFAFVVIAALVNRFTPSSRGRMRRAVFLFGFCFFCLFLASIFGEFSPAWQNRFDIASNVFAAFTVVDLVALSLFVLILPAAKVPVVAITSDIAVGISYIVSALAVFRAAGMDPSSVLATSAIVSGVLALSLQATLGNILGGVALQLDGSIHLGDWLQLENGKQGKVTAIRWRHTVLETRDWDTIVVPNATLLATQIQILGKKTGQAIVQHRMTFFFNVDFRYPPARVIDVVNEALRSSPLEGCASEPLPHCFVYDLAKDGRDSFGYYLARYWLVDLDRDDRAQSLVRSRVYNALRRAGIPLARPSTNIFVAQSDSEERRAESFRMEREEIIDALELFAGIPDDQRATLAKKLQEAPFHEGEVILHHGSTAQWLYLLRAGTVEVRTREGRTVATLRAPAFVGEMGLMTGEPRTADVVAITHVEGYRLGKKAFEEMLAVRPEIADVISKTLARRQVELAAVKEGLDSATQAEREKKTQQKILEGIQAFFGLKG